MWLIKINYYVMPVPDQVRDDGSGIQNTQFHFSWIPTFILLWRISRNDKSLRDNRKFISPKGEGFQPSPKETLN